MATSIDSVDGVRRTRRPDPVSARDYFSPQELARARAFRRGQRRLMLASMAVDAAVVSALVRRPPRLGAGPAGGAAAGALLVAAVNVAGLPLAAASRERSRRVGLVTQSWGGWAVDLVKSQAISSGLAAAGGALLVAGMRRFGRRWWLPGAGGTLAFGVLSLWAGPTLLDPVFNRFTPAEPELRDDITALASRAGIEVDRVLVMDASRRTTASNAYVTGLGPTKRVVFFDNLLQDFSRDEVRFVVAHELAHVRHRDVLRSLGFLAVAAPPALLAGARLAERLGARPDARAVAPTALALGLIAPLVGSAGNALSRRAERRADAFALEVTGDPDTLIEFHRRITVRNVGDPDPPRWVRAVFGSHPTTLERIAAAEAARA
jgi:STE24 endopeptidase